MSIFIENPVKRRVGNIEGSKRAFQCCNGKCAIRNFVKNRFNEIVALVEIDLSKHVNFAKSGSVKRCEKIIFPFQIIRAKRQFFSHRLVRGGCLILSLFLVLFLVLF